MTMPAVLHSKGIASAMRRYNALAAQRQRLAREADSLKRLQERAADKLLEAVRANGGKPLIVGRHKAFLDTKFRSVAWKTEFMERCGLDATIKIMENRTTEEILGVAKV
jgi:hypothetical protein